MYFFYGNPLLTVAAILPAIILLKRIYQEDRLEKEPVKLLVMLVLLGIISTSLAILTETIGTNILDSAFIQGSLAYDFLMYFVVVAVSEEGFKYLLLRLKTWKSPYFNCRFDGIVYSVFVSLGFALWENISYVGAYGLGTALLRAFTAIPGHASFAVFMGAFYGAAKYNSAIGNHGRASFDRLCALLVPILLHGTYDFLATSEYFEYQFYGFIVLMFFAAYTLVKAASKHDKYIDTPNVFHTSPNTTVYMNKSDIFNDDGSIKK